MTDFFRQDARARIRRPAPCPDRQPVRWSLAPRRRSVSPTTRGDIEEADAAIQEGLDRDFIGGIEHRRGQAAGAHGIDGEIERRKAIMRRRMERQLPQLGEIEPARRRRNAARPGQRMGDRRAHVGRGKMRHGGAVFIADQAMDDRLGMHHDIQFLGRQREQKMRLDQFQPLVHQGGAVE